MKNGKQIGVFDGLIASTAISKKLPLMTLDCDFKRIDKLELVFIEN